jgi:hypothetical protein
MSNKLRLRPKEATMGENWTGVEGSTEHRTAAGALLMAWCYQDHEWCYPEEPLWCDCCHEAAGFEKRWVPATEEDE